MTTILFGATGTLGKVIMKKATGSIIAAPRAVNVTDAQAIRRWLYSVGATHIINATGINVRASEADPVWAFAVNAEGAKNLADAADMLGAHLTHISTDYVFSGNGPFSVQDAPRPLNEYAKTKLIGERAVAKYERGAIIRTSHLFGAASGPIDKMVADAMRSGIVRYGPCIISPTYAPDLAHIIVDASKYKWRGMYHAVNSGEGASMCEVAQLIAKDIGRVRLEPLPADDVERPLDSRLVPTPHLNMPSWRMRLSEMVQRMRDNMVIQ